MTGERAYRALLLLYPRRFRREYRDPMLQLFRDARRERSSSWPRLAGDVVMSVPVQHKEAFRTMSTQTKLVALALVIATGIVVFAAIDGALAALALMVLLAWVLISLLRERGARLSEGFWWKLTLSGVGILAFTMVFFGGPWPDSWREAVPGELAWWLGFGIVALALVMIFAGLFTGIAGRVARRRLSP
jgi:hypothetical protein